MIRISSTLHPNIHKLVISQALSKFGDNFTEVALAIFVLSITNGSVFDLGVVLAMVYAPNILLGWAVAGVIDHFNKRRTLVVADVGRAVLVISIPVVHNYGWTVAAVFLMYSFAMIYRPMVRGVQPQIAGDPLINQKSGARQQTYYAVADATAFLAAAGVLFVWGVSPAFFINAATYLGASVFILSISVPQETWEPLARGTIKFWQQLKEGYRYLYSDAKVAQLTLLSACLAVGVGSLNTFTAPLSERIWHVSSHHYVWLVFAMAIGSLISGWLLEKFNLMERWTFRPVIALGLVLAGAGYALVITMPTWWLGAFCLMLVGLGNGAFGVGIMVWIQQSTPQEVRTRVLAIRGIGMGIGGALGAAWGGWFAQTAGLTGAILSAGALWIVLAVWCVSSTALGRSRVPKRAA